MGISCLYHNKGEIFKVNVLKDALIVTAKILRSRLTQKLNNYRGSDVRGDRQFELNS